MFLKLEPEHQERANSECGQSFGEEVVGDDPKSGAITTARATTFYVEATLSGGTFQQRMSNPLTFPFH